MQTALCAVSVDLDEVPNYFRIHGLAAPTGAALHAVYDVALARIEAFARSEGIPVTLFVVGEDLARPESARALRRLADLGHAVENHSLGHHYDFTRLGREAITREIEAGARAVEAATGRAPTGFRAPGYVVTDEVLDALEELSVAWDSSVFPCPAYYAAKGLAMALMRARGRVSWSVMDGPQVLAAPTRPYRPGRPYTKAGKRGLVELPIQVTPGMRLPVIGTSLGIAGPAGARWLVKQCVGEPLVNLELHGMDFLERADGLEALASHQPELRAPLGRRLDALSAALEVLRGKGYSFVRLDEAARALFPLPTSSV